MDTSAPLPSDPAKPARRVRVLIAPDAADDAAWADWQIQRTDLVQAQRVGLIRSSQSALTTTRCAVGLALEEEVRWFSPIDSTARRRMLLQFAEAVAIAGVFPKLENEWSQLAHATNDAFQDEVDGIWLWSHAETDLLALGRARERLPGDFVAIEGRSLLALSEQRDIGQHLGPRRSRRLVVVVRVHGRVDTVPGLARLATEAKAEGWTLIVISGVEDADPALATAGTVSLVVTASVTAYFMAGGVENVTEALRFIAHECLGSKLGFSSPRAMPAHGLFHPDLLVTTLAEWKEHRPPERPLAAVVFYRAHVLSGNLDFVTNLIRTLEARGFAAIGAFTSSLRDCDPNGLPAALAQLHALPDVVVNTVSFPTMALSSLERPPVNDPSEPYARLNAPVLQAIACGSPREVWASLPRGLSAMETAINVALPECDGRVITIPVSFKEHHRYVSDLERMDRVAGLAARLAALRRKPAREKRIAIVLTNASGKAQKVGNAVGLDTPASLVTFLSRLGEAGYDVAEFPQNPDALMAALLAHGSYDEKYPLDPATPHRLARRRYTAWFQQQPNALQASMREAWGEPTNTGPTLAPVRWVSSDKSTRGTLLPNRHEPNTTDEDYLFAGLEFGNVFIALQPPRGFGVDPEAVYHAPDLPPSHHYAAFYRWLNDEWQADAIVHFGKHGTLEWLPGKSVALSNACAPDALLGELPLFYPFVVNDPGEGAQAKRRAHAVIVDHLVPPLTHAETYGPLATLARLVEEYYRAESLDPSKLPLLQSQIWSLVRDARLEEDLRELRRQRHGNHVHEWDERPNEVGVPRALEKLSGRGMAHLLEDLDAYLCDLGRAQVRHGLHIFGGAPQGESVIDMLFAIGRCPQGSVPALVESVAEACGLGSEELREATGLWTRFLPPVIATRVPTSCTASEVRTAVDELSRELIRSMARVDFSEARAGEVISATLGAVESAMAAKLERVLRFFAAEVAPNLARTTDEITHLINGLSGRYVPAGPSGAPSRGMAHVLPTGRNFYTVDPRGLPSPVSWTVGQALARDALNRYVAETGGRPENIALSIWGTATMRTGGDEIAQALALLGVRPRWHDETRRTQGVEVILLSELGRPRIDVTLRVSGFFRDAFPQLIQLVDQAVRLVRALDEPSEQNFVRKHWLAETAQLIGEGLDESAAQTQAGFRIFSSKPGAYGAGLLELIENRAWKDSADLARAFLTWGGWGYGEGAMHGVEATETFRRRLSTVDLALHNQDNREHDIFDSDDYFQFHGGLVATIGALAGRKPRAYFGDSSEPTRPETRSLQGEALRVYRSRVVNPKWLKAVQRHGYKGGLEMAATVDYLFGFSATAGVVTDWMYEGVVEHYTRGEAQEFLKRSNPWALHAIAERLLEASDRKLWQASPESLEHLRAAFLASEADLEASNDLSHP